MLFAAHTECQTLADSNLKIERKKQHKVTDFPMEPLMSGVEVLHCHSKTLGMRIFFIPQYLKHEKGLIFLKHMSTVGAHVVFT